MPNTLFRGLAAQMLKIDPEARSSMREDLNRGRPTEVDYLQGVIIDLGERHGIKTPLARAVVSLIKQAEASGGGSTTLTPQDIREAAAAQ